MIPLIYVTLLLLMLFILYKSGKGLQRNGGKIMSLPGLSAILVYTLNEGLRHGRGVDFNSYSLRFNDYSRGFENTDNIGFKLLEDICILGGMPWQVCIIFMSFMFILGTLYLIKRYNDNAAIVLPLFCLLSLFSAENLIRWCMAFSFFMIGLSYVLTTEDKSWKKYFFFSFIACTIHYAFFPIPLLFILILRIKHCILHPFISIPLYFIIAFFFQTNFMLAFSDYVNFFNGINGRFGAYVDNADFWLTEGYSGRATSAFSNISEMFFICCTIYIGYDVVKKTSHIFIISYNLFTIGFLLRPIAYQIELIKRYDECFFFFGAIVLAIIIKDVYIRKKIRISAFMILIYGLIVLNMCRTYFVQPFINNPQKHLYIWDGHKNDERRLMQMWSNESDKASKKFEKK